jgi:hypothetical protein
MLKVKDVSEEHVIFNLEAEDEGEMFLRNIG